MASGSWIHATPSAGEPGSSPWIRRSGQSVPPGETSGSGPEVAPTASASEIEARGSSGSIWLWAFPLVIALPTELSLSLGGLRLTPYRLALLGCFVPSLLQVLQGEQVQRRSSDLWTALFAFWAVLALALRNGPVQAIESGGILVAESLGAYLLARTAVRSVADLRRFLKAMTVLISVLLAAGLPEMLSGQHLTHDLFGVLGNRPPTEVEGRFGVAAPVARTQECLVDG
jgi:hypothetical protein